MKRYSKAAGSGLGGAVVILILALTHWQPTVEVVAALTTVVTTALTIVLPNRDG